MNERIHIWRDTYGSFEHVGMLTAEEDHVTFCYDEDYGGPSISVRLPVRSDAFPERDTEIFFSALVPEGKTRVDFLDALRAGRSEYSPLLERLNDESSGALVFSVGEDEPGCKRAYSPIPSALFRQLALTPNATAEDIVGLTRLSIAGAMAKVGLYRDESTNSWFLPHGAAPSTHIVKAGNAELFPLEILNEALCLELARLCDLPVEEYELIATEAGPLLAARRFDRPLPEHPLTVGGHAVPLRLHQEDFCQIGGTKLKYEPTGGDFLKFAVSHASKTCTNSFGDAMLVFYYVAFSYLVGNCDNHLKNLSVLYDRTWSRREIAPLYDVVDTTVYRRIKDTMGISLSPSRSVFGVSRQDVTHSVEKAGLPSDIAMREFDALAAEVLANYEQARDNIANQGFPEVRPLAEIMLRGARRRAHFEYAESDREAIDGRM